MSSHLMNDTEQTKPEIDDGTADVNVARQKKTPNSIIRVGIIGAGLMGKWHASAAEKAGGKIVGVADLDKNRAARLSANYSSAQSFGGAAEMLDRKSIDVLHICAPTESHQAIAELAIKTGVNVFIEKPLAPTAEETVLLYDSAAKNNVRLCPAHQFVFQRSAEKARNLLPKCGRIIHLQANICSAGGTGLAAGRLDSIAADILPHPLSLFQTFLNELLSEDDWNVFRPQPGELRVFGRARKISLSIFVSMSSRPAVNFLQIVGTNGTIHLDLFHDFAVLETGKVSRARKILQPFDLAVKKFSAASFNLMRRVVRFEPAYPGLQCLVQKFYQSIGEDREPPITPEQAINAARARDYIMSRAGANKLTGNLENIDE